MTRSSCFLSFTSIVMSMTALLSVRFSSPRASSVRILLRSPSRIEVSWLQDAGSVVGVNHDFDGQRIARAACPIDLDFALRFIEQLLHVGALCRVKPQCLYRG